MIPVERIFDCLPRLTLTPKLTRLFLNGAPLSLTQFTLPEGEELAVWSEAGEFGHCRPRPGGRTGW